MAVQGYDGDVLQNSNGRQVRILAVVTTITGNTYTAHDAPILVPDDSVAYYSYLPKPEDKFIRIKVNGNLNRINNNKY